MSDEELLAKARVKVRVPEDARKEVARAKAERKVFLQENTPRDVDGDLVTRVVAADDAALDAFVEARRVDLENICASASTCASSLRDEDAVTAVLFKDVQVESGRLHQVESSLDSAQRALSELRGEEAALEAEVARAEEKCEVALAARRAVRANFARLQEALEMRGAAHAKRMTQAQAQLDELERKEAQLRQRLSGRVEDVAGAEINGLVDERVEEERARAKGSMTQMRAKHRASLVQLEAETRKTLEDHARTLIQGAGARAERDMKLLKRELARLKGQVETEREATRRARAAVDARRHLRSAHRDGVHLCAETVEDRVCEAEVARLRDSLRQILEDYPLLTALTAGVSLRDAQDAGRRHECSARAFEDFLRAHVLPHAALPCPEMVTAYTTTLQQMRLVFADS